MEPFLYGLEKSHLGFGECVLYQGSQLKSAKPGSLEANSLGQHMLSHKPLSNAGLAACSNEEIRNEGITFTVIAVD